MQKRFQNLVCIFFLAQRIVAAQTPEASGFPYPFPDQDTTKTSITDKQICNITDGDLRKMHTMTDLFSNLPDTAATNMEIIFWDGNAYTSDISRKNEIPYALQYAFKTSKPGDRFMVRIYDNKRKQNTGPYIVVHIIAPK